MKNTDIMQALNEVDETLLASALETKQTAVRKPVKKLRRTLLLAAAVVVLLVAGAVAAKSWGRIEEIYPENIDLISDYIVTDIPSVENDLLRLTVESAVTDGPSTLLLYSIERLDGGSLDGWVPVIDIRTMTNGAAQDMRRSGWYAPDEEKTAERNTDTKRWYTFGCTQNTDVDAIEINLSGLTNYDTLETLSCSSLELSFPLEPCGCKVGERGGDPNGEWLNSDIMLSPLSLSFHIYRNLNGLTGSGIVSGPPIITQLHSTVALVRAEGTVEDITENCLHEHHSSYFDTVHCFFPELRDVSDITAVRIDGRDYLLTYDERPALREYPDPTDYDAYLLYHLFGEHMWTEPVIGASKDGNGLTVKGVWTDGQDAELLLRVDSAKNDYADLVTADYNGNLALTVLDKDGNPLAVSAEANPFRARDDDAPLLAMNVHIGGTAEKLVINFHDAVLEIPLDMKKLKKLPQGEHFTAGERAEAKHGGYDLWADRIPELEPHTDLIADNGLIRIAIEYAKAHAGNGCGSIELLGYGEGLDGKRPDVRDLTRTTLEVLENGEWHLTSGSGGGSGMATMEESDRRAIHYEYSFDGDFVSPEALRITWRPDHGDPISIEIPLK